jgi:hypothetical protein
MFKKIFRFASYIWIFTLGLYASSQFVFGVPIESHEWLKGILIFVLLLFLSEKTEEKK